MALRRKKVEARFPDVPPPMPAMQGADMAVCKAAEPPRNRLADIARAEAFYVSLDSLPVHVDWDVLEAFKRAVGAGITRLRLKE